MVDAKSNRVSEAGLDQLWVVRVSASDERTLNLSELVDSWRSGLVSGAALCRKLGTEEWTPLRDVPELSDTALSRSSCGEDGSGAGAVNDGSSGPEFAPDDLEPLSQRRPMLPPVATLDLNQAFDEWWSNEAGSGQWRVASPASGGVATSQRGPSSSSRSLPTTRSVSTSGAESSLGPSSAAASSARFARTAQREDANTPSRRSQSLRPAVVTVPPPSRRGRGSVGSWGLALGAMSAAVVVGAMAGNWILNRPLLTLPGSNHALSSRSLAGEPVEGSPAAPLELADVNGVAAAPVSVPASHAASASASAASASASAAAARSARP
jgi:hypothetical protein